jgi:hypothetical protein
MKVEYSKILKDLQDAKDGNLDKAPEWFGKQVTVVKTLEEITQLEEDLLQKAIAIRTMVQAQTEAMERAYIAAGGRLEDVIDIDDIDDDDLLHRL